MYNLYNNFHPEQINYLEDNNNSIKKNISNLLKKQPKSCIKNIGSCEEISADAKNALVVFISKFDSLMRADKTFMDKTCIKNVVSLVNLIVSKGCEIDFTENEINSMLDGLAKIDLAYYNILTANVYTFIFNIISKKLRKNNLTKKEYNKIMLTYANKVRIFFHDSYIFDINYLTYVTSQLSARNDSESNSIYPYQMSDLGMNADFTSYFSYIHYLFNICFASISDVIRYPSNIGRLKSFINLFPNIMENFVLVPENIIIAQDSTTVLNSVAPGIYGQHSMSIHQAKIILYLILVFITELQIIFFGANNSKCDKLSEMLCEYFGASFIQCNKYRSLLRYDSSKEKADSFINKINSGFGNYRYNLLEYYNNPQQPFNSIYNTIRPSKYSGDITEDKESFSKIIKSLRETEPNFNDKLCKTVHYLRFIGLKNNSPRKCISSLDDIIDLFNNGIDVKQATKNYCPPHIEPSKLIKKSESTNISSEPIYSKTPSDISSMEPIYSKTPVDIPTTTKPTIVWNATLPYSDKPKHGYQPGFDLPYSDKQSNKFQFY